LHQKLLATFRVEHAEHVSSIRTLVERLSEGGPANPAGDLDEMFRRAHSLKGAARAVDLRAVEQLAHRLETLFSRVREGVLPVDKTVVDVVHLVLNTTEDLTASTGGSQTPAECDAALKAIEQVLGIEIKPKGMSSSQAAPGAPPAPVFSAPETVRVGTQELDQLLVSSAQLVAERLRQGLITEHLKRLGEQVGSMAQEWERVGQESSAALRQADPRPGLARLARHIESERGRARSLARQLRSVRLVQQSGAWQLRVASEQVQDDVCRTRLVPAESLFEGFPKMVRDLARDSGKEVEFRATGLDTRADRMVLQTLKDPVMHLLRNAVSHGIESPEERHRAGKKPKGLLQLRLESHGRQLSIDVEDDGKGLDAGGITKAAIEKGFLSAEQAKACSPRDFFRLLFAPGFSTSLSATALAGRGMGLSVVREAVNHLQGEVDLSPGEKLGAVIRLSVPLVVSTQHVVIVACCGQRFAIQSRSVQRLHRISLAEIETIEGKAALRIAGSIVPVFSLASLLDLGDITVARDGDALSVLVIRSGSRRIAVGVDAFLDHQDALIKDLGFPGGAGRKVFGGVLLPDGSVCIVLNPAELVETSRHSGRPLNLSERKKTQERNAPSILVVDDSLTTRALEKGILETQGYRVRLAVDGLEALMQLRLQPADLVITDLQMPRMDGFELVAEMKKDKQLTGIPVIVVSSMESVQDRERGLALGVDAYVVKKKFDQKELLEVIRQIL